MVIIIDRHQVIEILLDREDEELEDPEIRRGVILDGYKGLESRNDEQLLSLARDHSLTDYLAAEGCLVDVKSELKHIAGLYDADYLTAAKEVLDVLIKDLRDTTEDGLIKRLEDLASLYNNDSLTEFREEIDCILEEI